MRTRAIGPYALVVALLGVLLTGCQQLSDAASPAPVPTLSPSTDARQPVSDEPDGTSADDDAPPADRGVVSGRVRTPTGASVINAGVQVRSLDSPPVPVPELVVTTDDGGWFRWLLAPGRYEVTVVPADGTPPVTAPAVEVRAGREQEIEITVR